MGVTGNIRDRNEIRGNRGRGKKPFYYYDEESVDISVRNRLKKVRRPSDKEPR